MKFKIFIIFLLCLFTQNILSQSVDFNQGITLLRAGEYEKAIEYFVNELKKDKGNEDILYYLGQAYQNNDEIEQAVETYKKVLKTNPKNIKILLELTRISIDLKKWNDGLNYIHEILEKSPKNAFAYYYGGIIRYNMDDYLRAKINFSFVLETHPEWGDIYQYLGDIFIKENRLKLAENKLLSGIKHEPKNLNIRFTLGKLYFKQKKWAEAVKQLMYIYSYDTFNEANFALLEKSLYALSEQNYKNKKYKSAEKNIQQLINLNPNEKKYKTLLFRILFKSKRYLDLIDLYNNEFKGKPQVTETILNLLADSYKQLYDKDKKPDYYTQYEATLNELIDINHSQIKYYHSLYDLYNNTNEIQKSIDIIEKSLKANPDNYRSNYILAEYNFSKGKYKRALDHIKTCLKTNQKNARIWLIAGIIRFKQKEYTRAYSNLLSAYKIEPLLDELSYWIGRYYYQKDNYSMAIIYLNKAINTDKKNVASNYYLAMSYKKSGEYEKAYQIFKSIILPSTKEEKYLKSFQDFVVDYLQIVLNREKLQTDLAKSLITDFEMNDFKDDIIYYLKGKFNYRQKDYAQAIENFIKYSKLKEDPKALDMLSRSYIEKKSYQDALDSLLVLKDISSDVSVYSLLVKVYDELGNDTEIKKYYRLIGNPDKEIQFRFANVMFRSEKYDAAIKLYRNLIDSYKDRFILWYNSGIIRYKEGKYNYSLSNFQNAHEIRTDDISTKYYLGLSAYETKNYKIVVEYLSDVYKEYIGKDKKLDFILAVSYKNTGDYKNAVKYGEMLVKQDDSKKTLLNNILNAAYSNSDKIEDKIFYITKLIKYFPGNAENDKKLAQLYEEKKDYINAEKYYFEYKEKRKKLSQNEYKKLIEITEINKHADKTRQLIDEYTKSIGEDVYILRKKVILTKDKTNLYELHSSIYKMNPKSLESGLFLINYYVAKKDYKKVSELAADLKKYYPNNKTIISSLIESFYHLKQFAKAIRYWSENEKLLSTENEIKFLIGQIYYNSENYQRALKLFKGIDITKIKKNVQLDYYIGKIYYKSNNPKGLKYLKSAFDSDYKKDELRDIISDIYFRQGHKYIYLKDMKNALLYVKKSLEYNKNNMNSKILYIKILYQTGHYDDVIKNISDIKDISNQPVLLYYSAVTHYKLKNYEESLKYFDKAKKVDNNNSYYDIPKYIGLISMAKGDYTNAKKELIKYIETIKGKYFDEEALIKISELYLSQKKYKKAIDYLSMILEEYPSKMDITSKIGNIYYNLGEYNNAIKYFKRTVQNKDRSPEILKKLADSFYQQKNIIKSVFYYKQYIILNPDDKEVKDRLYNIYMKIGQPNKAKELIGEIDTVSKKSHKTDTKLFDVYLQNKEILEYVYLLEEKISAGMNKTLYSYIEKVIKTVKPELLNKYKNKKKIDDNKKYLYLNKELLLYLFEQTITDDKIDAAEKITGYFQKIYKLNDYSVYYKLSKSLYKKKDYNKAYKYIKKAIDVKPKLKEGYLLAAEISEKLDKKDLEEKYYMLAEKIAPDNLEIIKKRAEILFNNSKYQEFIEYNKKLLKASSEDYNALYQHGLALYYLEKYQDALKFFEEAFKLNKAYNIVYFIAKCHLNLGNIASAVQFFKETLQLKSDFEEALINLGNIYMNKLQKPDDALTYFIKLHELNNESIDALENLGLIYYQKKDYDNAEKYYNKLLKLKPDHIMAKKVLTQIEKKKVK